MCDIIRACAESGVVELHLGDMSVFFSQSERLLDGSRRTNKTSKGLREPSVFPETPNQTRNLKAEEARLKDDLLAEMELSDPELAEKIAIKAMEDNYRKETKLALRRQIDRPGIEPLTEEL